MLRRIQVKRYGGAVTEYAWEADSFPPSIELVEIRGEKMVRMRYVMICEREIEGALTAWYGLETEVKK